MKRLSCAAGACHGGELLVRGAIDEQGQEISDGRVLQRSERIIDGLSDDVRLDTVLEFRYETCSRLGDTTSELVARA